MLVGVSLVIAVVIGIVAVVLAASQRDPGPARWEQTASESVGVMHVAPYPFLEIYGENGAILLVRPGKIGLPQMQKWNNQRVRVRGLRLQRDGLTLLELDDGDGAISGVTDREQPASNPSVPQKQERVVLQGEIVDPKCFGGAMKPGDGKSHKACAVLCLRGGIPPTFVTTAGESLVMTDPHGQALTGAVLEHLLPFVGDRVELTGHRRVMNGLPTLRVDPATLRRL
jgi:hypothetical protein